MKINSASNFIKYSKEEKLSNQYVITQEVIQPQKPHRFKTPTEIQEYLKKIYTYYKSKDSKNKEINNIAFKKQIINLKLLDNNSSYFLKISPQIFPPPLLIMKKDKISLLETSQQTATWTRCIICVGKWLKNTVFKFYVTFSGIHRFKVPVL